jgi:hypothetical protein
MDDKVLTTQTAQAARDNIVTDLNANVPMPGAPAQRVISREAALLFNKSVVAKPLMVPEVASVHIKNTEYAYRWVFLGQSGQMYTKRKTQGFTNATTDDATVLGGDARADNGEIRAGDLILMKIRADIYDAAIKYNMEKALTLQRARGMYMKGNQAMAQDVHSNEVISRGSVAQENYRGKADSFIPDNPDGLMEASALMGGVEAARAQTEEIRERVQKDKAAKAAAIEE